MNCIEQLFSLRGERWKISILSHGIQEHSNSQAQQNDTDQIDDEARLSSGSVVKMKHQGLISVTFMQLIPGADQVD